MDATEELGLPGSPMSEVGDSGYETSKRGSCEPPGKLVEPGKFVFQSEVAFVTYSRSRVEDKEEFHRCLRDSLEPHLPWVSASEKASLELFGSKELHEDGTPHYHVVVRFSKRVHWRQARKNFSMWIDVDGERVVDTHSIYIRTREKRRESEAKWLDSVQSYVAKGGDVFGHWIGPKQNSAAEQLKILRLILETPSREVADSLMKEHFPAKCVWNQLNVQAVLRTKAGPPPAPYVPDFDVMPWKVPARMLQWRERNFPVRGGGRPVALVIIGPPRCGKSVWARSFGTPAVMDGRWDMDQLTQDGITHVVLNDIELKGFPNKRELAGCQVSMTCTGKYRAEKSITWGKPSIWTCNKENSVLKDKHLGQYLKQCGAVIVKVRGKLYDGMEKEA